MSNVKKISITLCTSFLTSLTVLHSSHATQTHTTQAPTTETSRPKVPTLYDKPLSEKHLPLPLDPELADKVHVADQKIELELACFYYPGFMVKQQVYSDSKGADKLAVTPFSSTSTPPICESAATADEKIITGNSNFDPSYFMGAKGPYVFFSGDDGSFSGSFHFAIFNSQDGKQLFTDAMKNDEMYAIQLSATNDLSLYYKRIYSLPCSPNVKNSASRRACEARIKKETALRLLPSCVHKYQEQDGIHYPVNVLLEKGKPAKMVPAPGKATCIRSM